ncbi:MAG: bifunctional phosphopantothenoylcysteine decarboxylase/phosphopantothenate--cysteine ligase CoaBC [Erysipelotrichaceae bacterium]
MKQTIVLGITGGIAAFKSIQLTSDLIKKGYDVEVIMSKNACEFVRPLSFEALSNHGVMVDTFASVEQHDVHHISIAKKASAFVIVPASANVISKIAHGLADDMLTTTFLACNAPKIICPAMNTGMYENPITQQNIEICKSFGMQIIEPDTGFLACGDQGKGKLASLDVIMEAIEDALYTDKILSGKKVCISAGPTHEAIDPVRYITNHSSGKMGYALATIAKRMGADVTLISGPTSLPLPQGVKIIPVISAEEMMKAIQSHYKDQDIIIKAAAVGDYRSSNIAKDKIKKQASTLNLTLEKNEDILKWLGKHTNKKQVLCGFAMETCDLLKNAQQKLVEKNADMIVANNLFVEGAGFKGDTNVAMIITNQHCEELKKMSKLDLATIILKQANTILLGR